jgi:hypothetical protein
MGRGETFALLVFEIMVAVALIRTGDVCRTVGSLGGAFNCFSAARGKSKKKNEGRGHDLAAQHTLQGPHTAHWLGTGKHCPKRSERYLRSKQAQ